MNETSEDSGFEQDSENDIIVESEIPNSTPTNKEFLRHPHHDSLECITPCLPLAQSGHSLEPDMIFGWRPNSLLQNSPVPLSFNFDKIPTKDAIFYGFRPEDSLELNDTYSGPNSYNFHIKPTIRQAWAAINKGKPKQNKRPFEGMKSELDPNELEFHSKFEGGNLDKVIKVKENEYDLYIRPDSNTYGHNQWYYFLIKNRSDSREIKLNIVNFSKRDSLYVQGMQPCILKNNSTKWTRGGYNIQYTQSKLNKLFVRKCYYSLSFEYNFSENEATYFAYSIPYSFSRLCHFVSELEKLRCVRKEILCKSLGGVEVPYLTVTDFESDEKKEFIFATARAHPGETHGSWAMEGFLKFITSNNKQAVDLRKRITFKILPMINIDGVILGNTRCSLAGSDLNRVFNNPNQKLHPTIFHLKSQVSTLAKNKKMIFYFDFHSHSKKKGVFMYAPHYPLHSDKYCKLKVLPKLMSESTEIFRYYSCKFKNDWNKRNAARLVIWKEFRLPFTYTMEISAFGYIDEERKTITFNEEIVQKVGKKLGKRIIEFIDMRDQEIKDREVRKQERLKRKEVGEVEVESSASSPVTKNKPRSMKEFISRIKEEPENVEDSSSSSDSSDDEQTEIERDKTEKKMNKNILYVFKQFECWLESPLINKKLAGSPSRGRKKEAQKPPLSALSKYFSRPPKTSSKLNRQSPVIRNESAIQYDSLEDIHRINKEAKHQSRIRDIAKLSYSRGLQAFRSREDSKNSSLFKKLEQKSMCIVSVSKKSKRLILRGEMKQSESQEDSPTNSSSSDIERQSVVKSRYPNQLTSIFGRQVPNFFARGKRQLLL
ncbi:unnamed protein product [Blepharisma stoltei]|uniref:Peptidase M14 domain-containing protein n=1 Tax=Blepharisma stoltei TaxID=1481888 RepID=A0AAU9ITW1_9CILI|nr:unnamed protein product [Blepharisma stoltei]